MRTERTALAAGVAVTLAALAAYLWRLLPDVGFWDTAVFQAAAPVLGLTHPTGYPTYLLLGWAWVHLLPFLEPAAALNALAAVVGALAVGMTFVLARSLGAGIPVAAAGALTFGFMQIFWRTAARADPHPLHVLLALVVVWLLLRWDRRRRAGEGDGRELVAAALVFGLGMGNHLLMAMLVPGIAVFVLTARPTLFRSPALVGAATLALLAGLAVYAYVPIRAAADPPIHYDFAPTTVPLFVRYVLGQDFAGSMTFLSLDGPVVALRELGTFVGSVTDALTEPVAIGLAWLGAIGLVVVGRDHGWRAAWLLGATAGLTLYARLTYANGDLERYALFPLAVLAALAAVGAQGAWNEVAGIARPRRREAAEDGAGPDGTSGLGRAVAALPAALLLVPLVLVVVNGPRVSIASARCYVDDVVARAPEGARIVSWWSMTTPLWYLQAVEGERPDLEVINESSGILDVLARIVPEGRPVYVVQLEGEVARVEAAGYATEADSFCGVGALRVVGGPAAAP